MSDKHQSGSGKVRPAVAVEIVSLTDLAKDPVRVAQLIKCYQEVFNDQSEGEWAENWTEQQVHDEKLFCDPPHEWGDCYVTLLTIGGQTAGMTITKLAPVQTIITAKNFPPEPELCDSRIIDAVARNLIWISGPGCLMTMYRELGIVKQFRGGPEPVVALMRVPLEKAISRGSAYCCFWTSRKTPVYGIMLAFGAHVFYDFKDEKQQVFMYGDNYRGYIRYCSSPAQIRQMLAERVPMLS
ncbi:MAG: hypothetical protein V1738_03410 [Patescibacteria group bacterium]